MLDPNGAANTTCADTLESQPFIHCSSWPSPVLQVHVALLRQSKEELEEARREAARRSGEVAVQRGEVQRLQGELRKEEGEARSAIREKQSLSSHIRRLSQELEELRSKHRVTGSNQPINPSGTHFIHPSIHPTNNF